MTGDQLRAPRVREGPESKQETFYTITDSDTPIHHDRKGAELKRYRDKQEHWETATVSHEFTMLIIISGTNNIWSNYCC